MRAIKLVPGRCLQMGLAAAVMLASQGAAAQWYGGALAVGDFDASGGWTRDDLAIGAPWDDWGAVSAGSVTIFWRTDNETKVDWIDQARLASWFSAGADGGQEVGDELGYAMAVGDFDHDGYKDLAISAPYEDLDGVEDAGCVHVLYGAPDGSGPNGMPFRATGTYLTRASAYPYPISATPEDGDQFGHSLAAGDLDGDGWDDLAVGAPGVTVNGQPSAGAVFVFYNPGGGFPSATEYTLVQRRLLLAVGSRRTIRLLRLVSGGRQLQRRSQSGYVDRYRPEREPDHQGLGRRCPGPNGKLRRTSRQRHYLLWAFE